MRPEADAVLLTSFGQMLTEVIPNMTAEYATGSTALISMMMLMSATEFDRAADVRARENAEMRALFDDAAPHVANDALRARIEEAAGTEDDSLKISALNAMNDRLLAVLIELHATVEETEAPWATEIEGRIWDLLVRSADDRVLNMPAL